ncbi:MAG: phage tail tape measure protein [Kiloniellales bacterium]
MAAESIRDLITRLIFKVDPKSVGDAEAAGEDVKKGGEQAAEGWAAFSAKIGLAIQGLRELGGIAGGVFKSLITNMTDATDKAAKTARAVGVTVGQLQELNFAAELSGGSANDVTKILGQLAKAGREATKGTKTFVEAFADLGVKAEDSQGKLRPTMELLGDVSDRFKGMTDGSEKTALAMKLFGRSGAKMIPFLSEGRSGLAKMAKEANRLGIVLSEGAAKKSERLTDAMLRAKSAVQGVRNRIAVALLPTLNNMLEGFALWASDSERVAKVLGVVKLAASVLGSVLATLAARQVVGIVAGFGAMILRAGAAVVAFFRLSAAQARVAITTRLLAGAFKLLAASGVLIIAAAIADLFKLATGKESVIAKALGEEGAADLGKVLQEIGGAFKTLLKELAPALAELLKAIAPIIPPIAKVLGFLVKILAVIVKGIIKAIKFVVRQFRGLGRVAGRVVGFISGVWDSLVSGMISGMETVLGPILAIKDAFFAVVQFVRKVWAAMVEFIIGLGKKIKNVVIKTINPAAKLFGIDLEKDLKAPEARVRRLAVGSSPTSAGGVAQGLAPTGRGGAVTQNNQNTTTVNVSGAGDPQAVANRVAATVAASQKEAQEAQLRQAMANLKRPQ